MVIPTIDCILTDFSIQHKMGTDNGPPFSRYKFREFAKKVGFKYVKVAPYTPWANETVEYFMQNLGKVLKTFNVNNQDWRTALYPFLKSF